jgi:hypothetical protein
MRVGPVPALEMGRAFESMVAFTFVESHVSLMVTPSLSSIHCK